MADVNNNKEVSKSLGKYTDYAHDGTNLMLNSANQINKWYAEQLNKFTESEVPDTRLETSVDNSVEDEMSEKTDSKLETKVEEYIEIQTDVDEENISLINTGGIQTKADLNDNNSNEDILEEIIEIDEADNVIKATDNIATNSKKINKMPKRIATAIKGAKIMNNVTNKVVRTGKNINTALNEGGLKCFENSSSRIMTKPIKKVSGKVASKVTKATSKQVRKVTKKVVKKYGSKVTKTAKNVVQKATELAMRLMIEMLKTITAMLPTITPIIIILLVIVCFCSFFGVSMSEETKNDYEQFMISTQEEYDKDTVAFYNEGHIVDGTIDGKGMINWKAPLSILQMLNGDLTYDSAEEDILKSFKDAGLFETVTDVDFTYDKENTSTDEEGNETTSTETVTETKKVVSNPSLTDYIEWCNKNFDVINKYKKAKDIEYDSNQKSFTDDEIEQIKLLYSSTSFFDLFGTDFQTKYAYLSVSIGDEQLQAIYDEFLKNAGKRYFMDHSNLSYDTCMDYYDCSSWTIHCLAHSGVATIPNTTASGIYSSYCNPVNVNDRQAGDLIFLKDTYNTGVPGGISHIGIYMGELTINGVTDEWIIDTGGNPSGVKISKYKNGWWNGTNFYGFGRLKQ